MSPLQPSHIFVERILDHAPLRTAKTLLRIKRCGTACYMAPASRLKFNVRFAEVMP